MEQDINKLKRLFYSNRLTQYGKRKLIEYYEKRIKELEEENIVNISENVKIKDVTNFINKSLEDFNKEYIPVSLVEEKLKKEKLPNIIVGGRRNGKALEYGKKLGRIEMCEELLERRK